MKAPIRNPVTAYDTELTITVDHVLRVALG